MEPTKTRLYSLDVFRGLTIAAMIIVNTPGDETNAFAPLKHSEWNGCTPTDIIFPAFIYMVGISIVFAQFSKRADLTLHGNIISRAFRRMMMLILVGWGIQLVYHFNLATLRYPGVLPRIGVVYFITTLLYLKLPVKYLWILIAGLLTLYLGLVVFIPVNGSYEITPTHNIPAYIDHLLIPSQHLAKFAYTDPCGLLGTIPSVATALTGITTGLILKSHLTLPTKLKRVLFTGLILVIAGLALNPLFPINKPLWSSSYVLFTSGICMVCFATCYWLIDIQQLKGWYQPFTVLGVNAISAYVLSEILPAVLNLISVGRDKKVTGLHIINDLVFAKILSPSWASLFSSLFFLLLVWLAMYWLYKKKVYIKI